MKLPLFAAAVCSTTFLVLVVATSRDSPKQQSADDDIGTLLASFTSTFDATQLANLPTATERLRSVLAALQASNVLPQLNTSFPGGEENSDLGRLISGNSLAVRRCVDSSVGHDEGVVNLLKNSRADVIQAYFDQYPDLLEDGSVETIVRRIRGLLESINYIGAHLERCIEDSKLRKEIQPTKIGLTSMAAYTFEEYKKLFTNHFQAVPRDSVGGERSLGWHHFNESECVPDIEEEKDAPHLSPLPPTPSHPLPPPPPPPPPPPRPLPAAFDWRNFTVSAPDGQGNYSVVTPVKNQRGCGSCFIFSATAAMETAFMRSPALNHRPNQTLFSEQALLNCALSDCQGGDYGDVITQAYYTGLTDAWRTGYHHRRERCTPFPPVARPSGFCQSYDLEDDETIQRVILERGPAAMSFNAEDKDFQLLVGPWNRDCTYNNYTTHAMTTVGWNEHHFIVKNSWGRGWGVDGYLYLKKDGTERCAFRTRMVVPSFKADDE